MRTFLGWTVAAALALAACGGNVVVDSSNGTTTSTNTLTTVTSTTGVTTTATTSGGPCVMSCAQAIASGGLVPCGGAALQAYDGLLSCACATNGSCSMSCGANFCLHQPVTSPCAACLQASCGSNYPLCQAN